MRQIRVGQVYCCPDNKKFEVTVIFVSDKNVVIKDRDGEESLISKSHLRDEYAFLRYEQSELMEE
jgi:hypothetical protein